MKAYSNSNCVWAWKQAKGAICINEANGKQTTKPTISTCCMTRDTGAVAKATTTSLPSKRNDFGYKAHTHTLNASKYKSDQIRRSEMIPTRRIHTCDHVTRDPDVALQNDHSSLMSPKCSSARSTPKLKAKARPPPPENAKAVSTRCGNLGFKCFKCRKP